MRTLVIMLLSLLSPALNDLDRPRGCRFGSGVGWRDRSSCIREDPSQLEKEQGGHPQRKDNALHPAGQYICLLQVQRY